MAVRVSGNTKWADTSPSRVLDARYFTGVPRAGRNYDISPDGKRFLMIKSGGGTEGGLTRLVVVQHFDEELKRLVPTK